jgi:hypothetical protein
MGRVKGGMNAPDERTHKMLAGLLEGKAAQRAAIDAGYTVRYARNYACKMARSLRMKQAMLEHAKGIKPGELGDIAKLLVQVQLTKRTKYTNAKEQLGYIRTALELDGQLGGPSELHLHQHSTLPPRVQKMLEDKMREILALKEGNEENGITTDAGNAITIAEGTEGGEQNQENDGGV